jgi:hypothetical protein
MNKSYLMSVFCISVLSAGLASCSPEKEQVIKKDVYKANPPRIRQVDTKTENVSVIRLPDMDHRQVDLTDELDFSENQPVAIEMDSLCVIGGKIYPYHYASQSARPLPVINLLTEGSLFHDFAKAPAFCNLEIVLTNAAGSTNRSTVKGLKIIEGKRAGVVLRSVDGTDLPEDLKISQTLKLDAIEITSIYPDLTHVRMTCEQARSEALMFEDGMKFSRFALLSWKSWIHAPDARPIQTCRLFAFEGEKVRAVSRFFAMILPREPLNISVKQTYAVLGEEGSRDRVRESLRGEFNEWQFAQVSVANTEDIARYIRIPKIPLITYTYVAALPRGPRFIRPPGETRTQLAKDVVFKDEEEFLILEIPAKGRVNFSLGAPARLPQFCAWAEGKTDKLLTEILQSMDTNYEITELDVEGQEVEKPRTLEFQPIRFYDPKTYFGGEGPPKILTLCGWY